MQNLKIKAQELPSKPGVYQFFDKTGRIIYIGKAKNLKKRVLSYFTKNHDNPKTHLLVKQIADIKFIVVETETDAFLLENNLIKYYQPKYNILLKDDKSYPWIRIRSEFFPRIEITRNLEKDGSEYYGPYTSVQMARTLLDIFKKIYKIRTCKLDLTPEKIAAGKFKVCLDFHIGNCNAPCVGYQSKKEYDENIEQIRKILKGKVSYAIEYLKNLMNEFVEKLAFEKAKDLKHKIELLEKYQSKSIVINPNIENIDVFSYAEKQGFAYVNFIKVVRGSVVRSYSVEIKKKLDEPKDEVLAHAIIDIRENIQKGISNATEILVPFEVDLKFKGIKIHVPKIGDKKKLLELSMKNLKFFIAAKTKERVNTNPHKKVLKILEQIKKDLHLKYIPVHIECFDNSNLQGSDAVSSCVVFKYGKPSKKDYRIFNVKTVEGIDDFATMYEVVFRRYRRLLEEGKPLPNLIIIDGGKGQLSAAQRALNDLKILEKVDLIAIAKRLDEIFKPGEKYPYYLDKNSPALKTIQYARDEAHRFGINFHRKKRKKRVLSSELTLIKGIGEKTAKKLLAEFKGIEGIKKASLEDLEKVCDKRKAKLIYNYFNQKNDKNLI